MPLRVNPAASQSDSCTLFNSVAENLFFIVGCGRSGTSLLQSMLGNHPDLAIPAETGFYPLVYEKQRRYLGELGDEKSMRQALDIACKFWRISELALDPDLVRHLSSCAPPSWETVFIALMSAFAAQNSVARIGEKSPHHVRYLGLLGQRFPKARFVHMVRDPRAVAASFAKVQAQFGRRYVADVCRQWRDAIKAHRQHAELLGSSRYKVVRYEELVRDPETVLRDLCAFLSLDYLPEMLRFHERSESGFHARQAAHMRNTLKPVFSSSVEQWRSSMPPGQIGVIEHLLRREMVLMGYDPSGIGANLASVNAVFNQAGSLLERLAKRLHPRSADAKSKADEFG